MPMHTTECANALMPETGTDITLSTTEGDREQIAARSLRIACGRDLLQDGRRGSGLDSSSSSGSEEEEDGTDAPDARHGRLLRRARARCDLRAARDLVFGNPNVSSCPPS